MFKSIAFILCLLLGSACTSAPVLSEAELEARKQAEQARHVALTEEAMQLEFEIRVIDEKIADLKRLISKNATKNILKNDGMVDVYSADLSKWTYERLDLIEELKQVTSRL